ncbi:MAG: hypothetical protein ACYTBJ_08010 [Planctomycetota bacterium]|jgi:hypothetical protein
MTVHQISMFGLLLILLIVGLVVLVLIKVGQKGRWILGGIALLLLFSVFALRFVSIGRPVRVVTKAAVRDHVPAEVIPAVWQPGIEDQFEADVYPSQAAALRALGRRMDRPIRMTLKNASIPRKIIVVKGDNDPQSLQELTEGIESTLLETNVFVEPTLRHIEPNEVYVTVDVLDVETFARTSPADYEPPSTRGRIEATALTQTRRTTIQARFVGKPWVENLSEFVNRNPGRRFIVARSSDSCTSESWAREQAVRDACERISPLLKEMPLHRPVMPTEMVVGGSDIQHGSIIVDHFAQSLQGSVGQIWRHALLLDVSPNRLTQLARYKSELVWDRRMGWGRIIFSIIGMIVLICVVYLFLNAATRGYYTLALRVAAFVLVIIGVFLILAFIS